MNLYHGGYGNHQEYVVARTEQEAILKLGIKINASYLPIEAVVIDNVDGYYIVVSEETEAKPTEIKQTSQGVGTRHCKKCDFVCENQGELMRHYADAHTKAQEV